MTAHEYHLLRTYGIGTKEYNSLRRRQKYRCGVCKRHEKEFTKRLSVDHNHATGEIRGLLCTHCNRYVIGRHKDPEIFYNGWKYLKKGTGWYVPKPVKKRKRRKTK